MDNYAGAVGNTNQALPPFPTFIRREQERREQERRAQERQAQERRAQEYRCTNLPHHLNSKHSLDILLHLLHLAHSNENRGNTTLLQNPLQSRI